MYYENVQRPFDYDNGGRIIHSRLIPISYSLISDIYIQFSIVSAPNEVIGLVRTD